MNLPASAVRRPTATAMVFLAILVVGIVALLRLPIDLFPDITPPTLTILTQYPGANAEDIEITVTEVLERGFATVSNLKKISSTSTDGQSIITLEFVTGTDLDAAANNVRDALEFVKDELPDAAQQPIIFKFSTNVFPIMFLAVTATYSYPGLDKLVQKQISDPLTRLPGVGAVFSSGGPVREIRIAVDPARLQAYHLDIDRLSSAMAAANVTIPAGDIKMGCIDYSVRVPAEFGGAREMGELVVAENAAGLVYLKDVATVKDTLKENTLEVLINGRQGLRLVVQKQSGANTVQVARAVRRRLAQLEPQLPEDVKVDIILDGSRFIISSIDSLVQAVLLGAVFVSLVILAFLRRLRGTIILLLAIPFSLIAAFIYLYLTGSSINIISLSSLSIAIGMVVDDAIVILENVTRHVERGSRPREAAVFGSSEVGLAVSASTLTIVAVFLPLVFLTGIAGVIFHLLGALVPITILMSLLAALTLIPMLASRLLLSRAERAARPRRFTAVDHALGGALDRLDHFYGRSLTWALHHRGLVILGALIVFGVSVAAFPLLGTEFLPQTDNGQLEISGRLAPGTRLEETMAVAGRVQEMIQRDYPQVVSILLSAGVSEQGLSGAVFGQEQGSYIFTLQLRLTPKTQRRRSIFQIADELRPEIEAIPGIEQLNISTSGGSALFFGAGSPIEIDVLGNDFDVTGPLAREIADSLRAAPGARNVEVSRGPDRPELLVQVDRVKAALLGLNATLVGTAVRNNLAGVTSSQFREEGNEYDIVLRYEPRFRTRITQLENMPLITAAGRAVRVKDVAQVTEGYAPPNIQRLNQERVVMVTASTFGRSLGQVYQSIRDRIGRMRLPPGVRVQYGGQVEQQQSSFRSLLFLLLLSIILVYMVMAAQFESLVDPFVIMFSVPFAFVGVVWSLLITHLALSVIAFIGAVILVGIVVKNAIVLVDYINLSRQRGLDLQEAIVSSGRHRLRPVLMTALTTLLGMLPLALSVGEASEVWTPLGVTVIGGLFVSTLITLVLVPVVYAIFERRRHGRRVV
jgi:HAE1 family hydrophobic/amphiphilic exporter-1